MLNAFLKYINEKKLFSVASKLLLAVSGGKDSVALLDLCQRAGFQIGIAHCNFQLRGEEANGDADFVRKLAEKYGCVFHETRFQTKQFAKKQGVSTQMAARQLRYSWFEEVRKDFGYDYILTAHHLNDSFETVLLNLVRGTGLAGLTGIAEQRDFIIRPLLFASRNDIENYVEEQQLNWREDSSNKSDNYKRNLLRHQVVPILEQLNPQLIQTFKDTQERLQQADVWLKQQHQQIKQEAIKTENEVIWVDLIYIECQASPLLVLAIILEDFGFSYTQSKQVFEARKQSGKVFYNSRYTLHTDRQRLIIKINQEKTETAYEITAETQALNTQNLSLRFEILTPPVDFNLAETWHFDMDKIAFPLQLRLWKQGDKFQPLGMKGSKKVSDFLIDRKVPLAEKSRVWILLDAQERIISILGYTIADFCKIDFKTKRIWQITSKSAANT